MTLGRLRRRLVSVSEFYCSAEMENGFINTHTHIHTEMDGVYTRTTTGAMQLFVSDVRASKGNSNNRNREGATDE